MSMIFYLFTAVIFGILLFIIVERICTHFFVLPFFKMGFTFYTEIIDVEHIILPENQKQTIKKAEGKFLFSEGHVLFRSQWFLVRDLYEPALFSGKAIGDIVQDHKIEIKGRLPLGQTLFSGLAYITLLAALLVVLITDPSWEKIGPCLLFLVIFGWLFWHSYRTQKYRMYVMVNELKEIIGAPQDE